MVNSKFLVILLCFIVFADSAAAPVCTDTSKACPAGCDPTTPCAEAALCSNPKSDCPTSYDCSSLSAVATCT